MTRFRILHPCENSATLTLETSNFVHRSAMRSLSLVRSECFLSGRGQGYVNNFYIVDLEKISPQQVVGIQVIYTQFDRRRFVYDT